MLILVCDPTVFPVPSRFTSSGQMLGDVAVRYKSSFITDNFAMAFFWVPANFVIYAVPIHLRLPLNHVISAAWSFILSCCWGAKMPSGTPPEAVAAP